MKAGERLFSPPFFLFFFLQRCHHARTHAHPYVRRYILARMRTLSWLCLRKVLGSRGTFPPPSLAHRNITVTGEAGGIELLMKCNVMTAVGVQLPQTVAALIAQHAAGAAAATAAPVAKRG